MAIYAWQKYRDVILLTQFNDKYHKLKSECKLQPFTLY